MKIMVGTQDRRHEIEIDPIDKQAGQFELRLGPEGVRKVRLLARRGDWIVLEIDGHIHDFMVFRAGEEYIVDESSGSWAVQIVDQRRSAANGLSAYEPEGVIALRAQMPGKVIRVLKRPGEAVEAGEGLIVIESMKMQNQLKSPKSGTIRKCEVRDGENVNAGQLLIEVE